MDKYVSPFVSRYASKEMLYIFSNDMKFKTWRKLWIALAKGEKKLGINITEDQIQQMEEVLNNSKIDYELVKKREKEVRHDVMAHVYAFGQQADKAAGIIHLGATSAYVGDNTDIIQMRDALKLVECKLIAIIQSLSQFADEYKSLPTLGFTHFQPAQLTTVGKRATLWINELIMDFDEIKYRINDMKLLGSKGTTGTQASFMELFEGNEEKVKSLEEYISSYFGFKKCVSVSGQTYSRKIDSFVLNSLSGIAQSAGKLATDVRLLQHLKEIEEPFEKQQIGSSAMPYKRNPMRSERICALARYVIVNSLNPAFTSYNQWFERTLDDSANKRISIPESFLAIDSILNLLINIVSGFIVYPKVIEKNIMNELPFMATENIMMSAVKKGKDRQKIHEKIRIHSIEASKCVKEQGLKNDLIERIINDNDIGLTHNIINNELNPKKYIGRCESQVSEFLEQEVYPRVGKDKDKIKYQYEINIDL